MDGLAVGLLILFTVLSLKQGTFFIAVSLVMKRRAEKEADPALAQFGIAKGCLSLTEGALFLWLLLEDGKSGWTIPVAFVMFVGGNWALSRLARRTPAAETPLTAADAERPQIH